MEVINKRENNSTVIYLLGELDNHNSSYARKKLDDILDVCKDAVVVFDLKLLTFMDSTGIGVLLGRYKKFGNSYSMYVTNINKTIDKVFQMAGLYQILPKAE